VQPDLVHPSAETAHVRGDGPALDNRKRNQKVVVQYSFEGVRKRLLPWHGLCVVHIGFSAWRTVLPLFSSCLALLGTLDGDAQQPFCYAPSAMYVLSFATLSMVPPAASTRALIARNTSRAGPVTSPQIHALVPITTGASAGASLLLLPGAVTAMDASPPLVLDQRHHLGGKALHPLQRLLDGGIGATDHHIHHHVTDTHLLVAFNVVSDLRGRAREGTPLPAGEPLGFLIIVPAGTIR
jgi:hypothetical protein